ncbi:MAG: hypothetical protein WC663_01375 [Patescibacteria group bacterium]|jgi:hypothetical protein
MDKISKKEKFPFSKIIIVAFVFAILGQIIHTIGAIITMPYYIDPKYFKIWSILMMPHEGPPPISFTIISLAFGLINGLIFASIYSILKKCLPGSTLAKKGMFFGLLVFLLAGISMFFTLALLINLPFALLIYWVFESLIFYLVLGLITANIIK